MKQFLVLNHALTHLTRSAFAASLKLHKPYNSMWLNCE
jgi:hypothetical protein